MTVTTNKKSKKAYKIALIALVFAILGWMLPGESTTTTLGLNITVNNTNLAPTFPGEPVGTGERIQNETYWTNDSDIELFVFGHSNVINSELAVNLSINGTHVAIDKRRPVASAQNAYAYISAIIPRYSNYSVNITNYHHYEWREYKIYSGNVTTIINTTGSSGAGCEGNCSFDGVWTNSLRKNDTFDSYGAYINLSAPFGKQSDVLPIFSFITLNDGEFYTLKSTNSVSFNYSEIFGNPEVIRLTVSNSDTNQLNIFQNYSTMVISGTTYTYNNTHADYSRANITNVANISYNKTLTGSVSTRDLHQFNTWVDESFTPISTISENNYNIWSMSTMSNTTAHQGYFGAHRSGWNASNNSIQKIPDNAIMFTFFGKGFDGNSWAASSGRINIVNGGVWNTTSHPTEIDFYTENVSSSVSRKIKMDGAGNIKMYTAGKGITMLSPDGNDWCLSIANGGILSISSTPCS